LFDPNVLLKAPERPQAWDAFPLQHSEFAGEAWADAPKVDPRDPGFRQLSVPEAAKVHYDDHFFEATTYVDLTPQSAKTSSTEAFVRTEHGQQPAEEALSDASADAPAHWLEAALQDDQESAEPEEGTDPSAEVLEEDQASALAAPVELAPEAAPEAHDQATQAQPAIEQDQQIWQQRMDDAVAQARQEAYEQGLQAGLSQGQAQALEDALAQAKAEWEMQAQQAQQLAIGQAVERALAEQLSTLDEKRSERDARVAELMTGIDATLKDALNKTTTWSEAIKRLAIHVAEQLVLSELTVSPAAIQRLIDRCVSELDLPHAGLVTVELAPHDHDLLKAQTDLSWSGMEMVVNPQLAPGSVKVSCKDTRISDLILHRLEPMARQLLVAVDDWQQQSAFKPGALGARAGFQTSKTASSAAAITPLSVSSRLIDASDHGGDHG